MMEEFYSALRYTWSSEDVIRNPSEDDIFGIFLSNDYGQRGLGEIGINVFEVVNGEPQPFTGFSLNFYHGVLEKAVVSAEIDKFATGEQWSCDLLNLPFDDSNFKIESRFVIPKSEAIEIAKSAVLYGKILSTVSWDDPGFNFDD